jgi:hypothetical protein
MLALPFWGGKVYFAHAAYDAEKYLTYLVLHVGPIVCRNACFCCILLLQAEVALQFCIVLAALQKTL